MRDIATYQEFWGYYLREHSKPATRYVHFAGTTLSLLALAAVLVSGSFLWLVAVPVAGYAPAWIAHFWIEGNRPATFRYPLWSLWSDLRMYYMWMTGNLEKELKEAQAGLREEYSAGK